MPPRLPAHYDTIAETLDDHAFQIESLQEDVSALTQETLSELEQFLLDHKPQLDTLLTTHDLLLDHKLQMDKILSSQDILRTDHSALATTCTHHIHGTTATLKEYSKSLDKYVISAEGLLYDFTLMQTSNTDMKISLREYMGKQGTTNSLCTSNQTKICSLTSDVQWLIDTVTALSPTIQQAKSTQNMATTKATTFKLPTSALDRPQNKKLQNQNSIISLFL